MSHLRKHTRGDLTTALIKTLSTVALSHRGLTGGVVGSLESMSDTLQAESADTYSKAEDDVRQSLRESIAEERGVDVEEITEEDLEAYENGIESAALVLMSHGNLRSFRAAAASATAGSHKVVNHISGSFGNQAPVASVESFDVNKVDTFKAESITYNLQAPRQDAFAEMFYRTYIGTPDQAMFKAVIDRIMIAPRVEHTLDGEAKSFNKRNLLEAYRDPSVLNDNSTDLIPNFDAAKNAKYFVGAAVAPVKKVVVNGQEVTTKPLVVGQRIGLIGISSNEALIASGLMDQNEAVDHNAGIGSLIVKVNKGATNEYFEVDTLRHPSSRFIKTPQGHGLDARSNLRIKQILREGQLSTTETPLTLLDGAFQAGLQVTLSLGADSDLNFERGTIDVSKRTPEIVKVTGADGRELAIDDQATLEGLTFEIVGFVPDARRTNSTRRSAGHRVDIDRWEEVYPVGLLAPIIAQDPLAPYTVESKMKALVQATHVLINNSAVTALLNTAEHLDNVVDHTQGGFVTADSEDGGNVEGIARMVIKPHYRETTVDLVEVISNISSKDKLKDVQGYFTGLINEIGYRMVQNTGYRIAARALNGGVERDPMLLIGSDEVLPAFMMIQGDDRTSGIKLKHQIESSSDQRMFGKIVIALGQEGTGFLPLNFGNFLWIPELVSEIPIARNGENIRETMVQPRFRHICNTPAMEIINVLNLEAVMKNRTALNINDITPVVAEPVPEEPAP